MKNLQEEDENNVAAEVAKEAAKEVIKNSKKAAIKVSCSFEKEEKRQL